MPCTSQLIGPYHAGDVSGFNDLHQQDAGRHVHGIEVTLQQLTGVTECDAGLHTVMLKRRSRCQIRGISTWALLHLNRNGSAHRDERIHILLRQDVGRDDLR